MKTSLFENKRKLLESEGEKETMYSGKIGKIYWNNFLAVLYKFFSRFCFNVVNLTVNYYFIIHLHTIVMCLNFTFKLFFGEDMRVMRFLN